MDMPESYTTFGTTAREWVAEAIGTAPQNLEIRRIKGATSSSVFLIRSFHGSASERFVLRVLSNQEWLAQEPDLAVHEAAALQEAQRAGLKAPRLAAYSTEDVGFGAPVVLMTFLEGNVIVTPSDLKSWLEGLVGELACIHRHRAATFAWTFRSWVNLAALAPPVLTTIPHVWERAIERVSGPAPSTPSVFIHRDYHPTNVLWQGGVVSGVVDWINACQGPAGVDVAHCRTNLALMFGTDAADQFLGSYRQVADRFEYDPYWDLDSVLDMCLPQPTFYAPWEELGLGILPAEELNRRVDAYLASVVRRL